MQRKAYILVLLLTILGAIGLMGGCSKNGLAIHQLASDVVIGYHTSLHWEDSSSVDWEDGGSVDWVETKGRAVNDGMGVVSNGNVRMYAYYMDAAGGSNITSTNYFSAQLVFSSGAWNTFPVYYWPYTTLGSSPSKSISFFAYQPENSNLTNYSDESYCTGSSSKPTFKYTTPADVNNQQDLLTAVSEFATYEGAEGSTNGQVGLKFDHALVKLGFVSKISGLADPMPNVNLLSVKVTNVFPTATYSYGSGWTGWEGTKTDYEALISSPVTLTTSPQNIIGDGQFMFLIPQSTADISLEVRYEVDGTSKTSTVSLSHYEWTSGKGIVLELNYKIETNGSITFILNLINWDDEAINTEIT